MKEILVKEVLGSSLNAEDAILLRELLEEYLDESITLDFEDIKNIKCSFFASLLTELICKNGRDYIVTKLKVKNLTNTKAFNRVLLGTSYCQ